MTDHRHAGFSTRPRCAIALSAVLLTLSLALVPAVAQTAPAVAQTAPEVAQTAPAVAQTEGASRSSTKVETPPPIRTDRPWHITGTVVDDSGDPVPRVKITVHGAQSVYDIATTFLTGVPPESVAEERTAGDGTFSATVGGDGFWDLKLKHPDFAPAQILSWIPIFRDTHFAAVTLLPRRTVAIDIFNEQGAPIQGALVAARSVGYFTTMYAKPGRTNRVHSVTSRRRSAASGRATIPTINQAVKMTVRAEGYLPEAIEIAGTSDTKRVTLQAAKSLQLRIAHADGVPAPGAIAFISDIPVAIADALGQIILPIPLDRDQKVKILHSSQESGEFTLRASLSETDRKRPLLLQSPRQQSGRIVAQTTQAPVPQAWAWRSRAHPSQAQADGRFTLTTPAVQFSNIDRGVRPSQVLFGAAAPDHFGKQRSVSQRFAETNELEPFALARAIKLIGVVVDERGTIVRHAELKVTEPLRFNEGRLAVAEAAARTGEDGTFELWPVARDAPIEIQTSKKGFGTSTTRIEAIGSSDNNPLVVRMVRGLLLTGGVQDEAGQAIAGAEISLAPTIVGGTDRSTSSMLAQARLASNVETVVSDTSGRFQWTDKASGQYDLTVHAPSFARALIKGVQVLAPPLADDARTATNHPRTFELGVVTLSPGATIRGRVENDEGLPVEGAVVQASAKPGSFGNWWNVETAEVTTDSNGAFTFNSLTTDKSYSISTTKEDRIRSPSQRSKAPSESPLLFVLEVGSYLEGVVTDGSLAPIEGASVKAKATFSPDGRGPRANHPSDVATDSNGRFKLGLLGHGSWTISAAARGYLGAAPVERTVTADAQLKPLAFQLNKGLTLEGNITDSDGQPIANASIQSISVNRTDKRPPAGARADAEGNYRIDTLVPGKASFEIKAQDFLPTVRDVEITTGSNRLDVRLDRSPTISGTVYGVDGEPLAGAEVTVKILASSGGWSGPHPPRSDENGEFRLTRPPGRYQLHASIEGLPTAVGEGEILLGDNDVSGLEIHFEAGGSVTGTVIGLTTDELAETSVSAWSAEPHRRSRTTQPDHEGRYRLDHLAQGDWQVGARFGRRSATSQDLHIQQSDTVQAVDLEFVPGHTLSGQVLRHDEPVMGQEVSVLGERGGALTTTDANGRFEIENLNSGTYQILAGTNISGTYLETIVLDGDQDIVLRLLGQTVEVRVSESETGAPLAGVRVTVVVQNKDSQTTGFRATLFSDTNGQVVHDDVPPGTYELRADADGFIDARTQLTVTDGRDPLRADLKLERAGPMIATFLDARGRPLRQGYVSAIDANGHTLFTYSSALSAAGSTEVRRAPEGKHVFLFSSQATPTVRRTVTIPARDRGETASITVVIPGSGRLAITVPELVASKRRARYTLTDASGELVRTALSPGATSHWIHNGRTATRELEGGSYTVTVTSTDGQEAATEGQDTWETTAHVILHQTTQVIVP